jgi:SAM-dependent methyltransferase
MAKPYYLKKKFLKKKLQDHVLFPLGYQDVHWTRVIQYRDCFDFIRTLGPENLDVLEISAGHIFRETFNFKSFSETQYPDYDLEKGPLERRFDLIIADHVILHLDKPVLGVANMRAMLKDGGHLIVTTPFLIHANLPPQDVSRWTERGLSNVMVDAGFERANVRTGAWGNRACVVSNFTKWTPYGFGIFKSLKNEPDFPVSVWAFAKR